MRLLVHVVVLLVLSVALMLPSHAPVFAQADTQPGLQDPNLGDPEMNAPPPLVPLIAPKEVEDSVDRHVKMDGAVHVECARFTANEWRYRIENGSDEAISSVYFAVPDKIYDSRIVPFVPLGWVVRRERGEGKWKDQWLLSFFAGRPQLRLKPGQSMEIAVESPAQLLVGERSGQMSFGTSPFPQLVYPWDTAFYPFKSAIVEGKKKAFGQVESPYPQLSFLPLPRREVSVQQGLDEQCLSMVAVGQGVHSGTAFQVTLRTPSHLVATLPRGAILVPSLDPYDVFIVGRSERVIMGPNDTATFAVRAYSISYGRKAPPPRLVLHDLQYSFPKKVPRREVDTYVQILSRANRLVAPLDTPLREGYYDTVVQWALWRAQRLMEGNPLSVRDVERSLTQAFTLKPTQRGAVRVYLQPLQIYQTAKRIWSDTEVLMYEQPPQVIP